MDCIINECLVGNFEYFFSLNYSIFPIDEPTLVKVLVEVEKPQETEDQ